MLPRISFAGGLLFVLAFVFATSAAPPQVTKASVQTLQIGGTTTVIIEGVNLLPNPRLVTIVPIAEQNVKEGATATKVQIDVKLADNVAPGVYQLRVSSDKGISAPFPVEIDKGTSQPFGPTVASLPATLHGTLAGSATVATSFQGKKGQRLVIEVEARRLGSAIDPVVKLYDGRRLQLAWARGITPLAGDARLTTQLPADGPYTIEVHDLQYKAAAPGRFRLRIGDFPYTDLAFPLAGQRGGKASFELIGSVPAGTRVEADLTTAPAGSYLRLPGIPGVQGGAPSVLVSDIAEVMKSEQAEGKIQEVAIPAGINGRLTKPKTEDRYRLAVQPGMKLRFDVLAERAGSPLDGVLILRNEAGMQLVRSDDQPGTLDPGLDYTVPAGVTALVAAVSDLHDRAGPEFIYRLAVTPVDRPDFTLALLDDLPQAPVNGAALVRVRATRSNYQGPIKLTISGLPEGLTVTGTEIPAGATDTLLSFTALEGAKPIQGVLRVIGESTEPNGALRREALLPESPLTKVHPALRGELAVAVTEPGPIGVTWDLADASLPVGASLPVKFEVRRPPETKGSVRLSLVTSQVIPKGKDGKEDIARAIRLEGTPMIVPDKPLPEIKILVPVDLHPLPYDIALRADLLAADNKTVQASSVTPVRRLLADASNSIYWKQIEVFPSVSAILRK